MNGKNTAVFRIAIREEPDGFVRAYLAPMKGMDGAVCVASIAVNLLRMDESIFDAFRQMMRLAGGAISVESFGVAPDHYQEAIRKKGDR